jgi:prokaryotic ubiquitin-like protein Pup
VNLATDREEEAIMAEQRREGRGKRVSEDDDEVKNGTPSELTKKGEDLKEALDDLLDELDDLLEENAEEFVASYVQRGGQ